MIWKTTKHTVDTAGKTESYECELYLLFDESRWNKNTERPVIRIRYSDRKVDTGWWIDKAKSEWWDHPKNKSCYVQFMNYQSMNEYNLTTQGTSVITYDEFTLDYCKEHAVNIFKSNLTDILEQL